MIRKYFAHPGGRWRGARDLTVVAASRLPAAAEPVAQPSRCAVPGVRGRGGDGRGEHENIAIGTPVGNIVSEVLRESGRPREERVIDRSSSSRQHR